VPHYNPDFLKVLPSDAALVGLDGAALYALLRFWTSDEAPRLNAVSYYCNADGARWVRASYKEIAHALGVSEQAATPKRC
jgi:hypothetical protein